MDTRLSKGALKRVYAGAGPWRNLCQSMGSFFVLGSVWEAVAANKDGKNVLIVYQQARTRRGRSRRARTCVPHPLAPQPRTRARNDERARRLLANGARARAAAAVHELGAPARAGRAACGRAGGGFRLRHDAEGAAHLLRSHHVCQGRVADYARRRRQEGREGEGVLREVDARGGAHATGERSPRQ
eukprot:2804822-Prymnesium_polylepis.1